MYDSIIKEKVRNYRKGGHTFREILKIFPFLSKGTVSEWVKDIKLTSEQEEHILQVILKGRKKFLQYNKQKHLESVKKAKEIISSAKREIGKLSRRDLLIIGTSLYWAEGYKRGKNQIQFINSDPKMILLMMKFFREIYHTNEDKFRCKLIIHPGLNQEEALNFWSSLVKIPLSQFNKVYIKPPKSSSRKMHNILYKGTLRIAISDTKKLWRLKGAIQALSP